MSVSIRASMSQHLSDLAAHIIKACNTLGCVVTALEACKQTDSTLSQLCFCVWQVQLALGATKTSLLLDMCPCHTMESKLRHAWGLVALWYA